MNKYFPAFIILLFSNTIFAQQDNYSFIKLMVFNSEGKVLLVKWNGAWEVPGIRYNQPITLSKYIDTLSAEHGISVQDKKLSGLFTFEYENRPTLTIMQYYTAQYSKGELKRYQLVYR